MKIIFDANLINFQSVKTIPGKEGRRDSYRLQLSDGEKHRYCELLFCVPRMKYGAPCTAVMYWLCRLALDSSCSSSSASFCQFFFFF